MCVCTCLSDTWKAFSHEFMHNGNFRTDVVLVASAVIVMIGLVIAAVQTPWLYQAHRPGDALFMIGEVGLLLAAFFKTCAIAERIQERRQLETAEFEVMA